MKDRLEIVFFDVSLSQAQCILDALGRKCGHAWRGGSHIAHATSLDGVPTATIMSQLHDIEADFGVFIDELGVKYGTFSRIVIWLYEQDSPEVLRVGMNIDAREHDVDQAEEDMRAIAAEIADTCRIRRYAGGLDGCRHDSDSRFFFVENPLREEKE